MSLKTVKNIVDEIRSKLDEENNANLSDENDLLPLLNSALTSAANILSSSRNTPLLAYTPTTPIPAGTQEFDIPADICEDRVEKVEVRRVGATDWDEMTPLSFREIERRDSSIPSYPRAVCYFGKKLRLIPNTMGGLEMRLWYVKQPTQLVLPQGRVTRVSTATNSIVVDSVGADVSADVDSLEAFVNVVNGLTGEIRATFQVQWVEGQQIKFKSIVDAGFETVEGRTVSTDISALGVRQGDLICNVSGSCASFQNGAIDNYLIQKCMPVLRQKLGGSASDVQTELMLLKEVTETLQSAWAGRQGLLRKNRQNVSRWQRLGLVSRRSTIR